MDIKHLIDEIAKKHHVILKEEDPLFLSVTLNEQVLQYYVETLDSILQRHHESIYEALQSSISEAKEISAKLITQTSVYLSDNAKTAMLQVQNDVVSTIHQEFYKLNMIKQECDKNKKHVTYFVYFGIASAIISLFSLFIHILY